MTRKNIDVDNEVVGGKTMLVKAHKSSRDMDFMPYLKRNPNLGLLNHIQASPIVQNIIFFHIFSLSMDITKNCE